MKGRTDRFFPLFMPVGGAVVRYPVLGHAALHCQQS